jgi:hypothetical protein
MTVEKPEWQERILWIRKHECRNRKTFGTQNAIWTLPMVWTECERMIIVVTVKPVWYAKQVSPIPMGAAAAQTEVCETLQPERWVARQADRWRLAGPLDPILEYWLRSRPEFFKIL